MAHDLRITARAEKKAEIAPSKIENKFTIQGGSKLEVFDEDGGKLYEGEFKSFTSNFLKLLYGSMLGSGTAKAKDLSNTDLAMDSFPQSTFNIAGGAGVKKFGVVVGTNTAAVSVSDYNISVPAGLTVNDTVVSASSVGADSISVEISRQIGNSSGSTVNLKEAGLICGSEDEVDSNVLIARDLLDITLESGKKSIWRYTINFNFANNVGGFVKAFADKIFGGIFEEVTTSTIFSAREQFGFCIFDGKMWVMGGFDGTNRLNDVWCTSDGANWIRITEHADWSPRNSFGCYVYNSRMWVVGGTDGANWYSDAWYSTDGSTWNYATMSATSVQRSGFGGDFFVDRLWIMGGDKLGWHKSNDIVYSYGGDVWTNVTPTTPYWTARSVFGFCIFDGKMWVMGGFDGTNRLNDVWCTSDGANWTRITEHADWLARSNFGCYVYNSRMWVIGGSDGTNRLNDVWCTSDGANWTRITEHADWLARSSFGCYTYNSRMWVIGGSDGTNRLNDVYNSKLFTAEIIPGSSDSAFSATGTALGAVIANGSESGELVYGTMPGAGTTEPSVSGNKTKMSIAREFTNNSGADITVREVGLFSGADMLARLILANPVTIANGGSEIITVDFETEV